MESKTSSGQILIECAIALFIIAIFFSVILDFEKLSKYSQGNTPRQKIKNEQRTDLSKYRNGN